MKVAASRDSLAATTCQLLDDVGHVERRTAAVPAFARLERALLDGQALRQRLGASRWLRRCRLALLALCPRQQLGHSLIEFREQRVDVEPLAS